MADQSNALDGVLALTALTPLHPGSGSGFGLIDNPIIRERSTAYPFIQAPSLKGVLRQKARDILKEGEAGIIHSLFGPERSGGGDNHHEGAMVFNDARIFAMPVRSLKGLFVWITSPVALNRFFRDFGFCGGKITTTTNGTSTEWNALKWLNTLVSSDCFIPQGSKGRLLIGDRLYLEEFEIPAKENSELQTIAGFAADRFYSDNPYLKGLLKKQLVLLNDELFAYFIENATQIEANIAIDQDKGTTMDGSLRYTEFLPAETLMYASYRISVRDYSKKDINPGTAFNGFINQVSQLRIGGDETTGKGFAQIRKMDLNHAQLSA